MGTIFDVYLHGVDQRDAHSCFQVVFEEIERVEKAFSRFLPASEITRINRNAPHGPVVTDPEVFRLLTFACDLSQQTGGAFDITVGHLTRTWGFSEHRAAIPDAEDLRKAKAAVGWEKLQLDSEWRTVEFLHPDLELDFGAIAKGYALDCALTLLSPLQMDCLISAGSSSIAATGDFFSQSWPIAIADPLRGNKDTLGEIRLGSRALSTSGVREQSFNIDGRIYSHLLDPRETAESRTPAEPTVLQVTVLSPSALVAEGLSTSLFLLGPEKGKHLLQSYPQSSALWVCGTGDTIELIKANWRDQDFSEKVVNDHGTS